MQNMIHMVKAYGLTPDAFDVVGGSIDTPEATFQYEPFRGWHVTMWSGAWPFAHEHEMGCLRDFRDALSYAVWLLKREAFYHEKMEAQYMEPPSDVHPECDGCDIDPWVGGPHYGTCPLAPKGQ